MRQLQRRQFIDLPVSSPSGISLYPLSFDVRTSQSLSGLTVKSRGCRRLQLHAATRYHGNPRLYAGRHAHLDNEQISSLVKSERSAPLLIA